MKVTKREAILVAGGVAAGLVFGGTLGLLKSKFYGSDDEDEFEEDETDEVEDDKSE